MKVANRTGLRTLRQLMGLLASVTVSVALVGCGGGGSGNAPAAGPLFQVGTTSHDANLPNEPTLPTDDQVCAKLEASNNLVTRPDGALPPESDPSVPGVGVAVDPAKANPDQARIQAALDACGAAVNAEVGTAIGDADAAATAAQVAAAVPNKNISGASGESWQRQNTVRRNSPCALSPTAAVRVTPSSAGR